MPISVVFDPPLPSDSPSTFNTKAFTLLGDLNDWSTQANALPGEVATNLTTLLAAPPAIGSTTPAAGSFTTLSVNTVSTDVKAVVGSSVAKATTASTEVVWVKSSDTSNALTLAIGINSNATASSRGAYLQAAEQGVVYRNLLIQPDGGDVQIGSPSGSGAVTIPGSLSLTGGTFGYGIGAGGTVTQATSKSTAVTLNKPCGQITMNNAALAAGAVIAFSFFNNTVSVTDTVLFNVSGGTLDYGNYSVMGGVTPGAIGVYVKNLTVGSLSDALVINFAVIKGATA